MDELEFRRRALSDPKQRDKSFLDAATSSDANGKFLEDVLDLDGKIADAFQVDVPEDLADRILFNQPASADRVARPTFASKAMALAASVAFVFGLLIGQLHWGNLLVPVAQASLSDMAIHHVLNEEPFVGKIDEKVSSAQINAKINPFDYGLSGSFPYHVYYLNHCGFGESNAVHMVFAGKKGKVTLFLTQMPAEKVVTFDKDGMSGVIEPMGNKSLILVGNSGENIMELAAKITPMIKTVH